MSKPPGLSIERGDFAAFADDDLRAVHAIVVAGEEDRLPGEPTRPFHIWREQNAKSLSFRRGRWYVARNARGIIGYASTREEIGSNEHITHAGIEVARPERRNRIGTELLRLVVDDMRATGRTSLTADAREDDAAATALLRRFGLTPRITTHHNRLRVGDVDVPMLHEWVSRAQERASGYDLIGWETPTPPELAERFAAIIQVMNTAPTDDLEVEDEIMTPEHLREREAVDLAAGQTTWFFGVVERASGEFAGYTELRFRRGRDDLAHQGDTAVDPAHRNKGIGRWLKAAMLLRLIDERPDVETVETWNARSNDAMLGINHALGFSPMQASVRWQQDVDVIAKHLEET